MACDGYEHGTRVEYVPSPEQVSVRPAHGSSGDVSWHDFAGAVGIVDAVDRRRHEVTITYPGYVVSGSAHAVRRSSDRRQSNVRWILNRQGLSLWQLAVALGVEESTLDERLRNGRLDETTRARILHALNTLAAANYQQTEVFPHDTRPDVQPKYSAGTY